MISFWPRIGKRSIQLRQYYKHSMWITQKQNKPMENSKTKEDKSTKSRRFTIVCRSRLMMLMVLLLLLHLLIVIIPIGCSRINLFAGLFDLRSFAIGWSWLWLCNCRLNCCGNCSGWCRRRSISIVNGLIVIGLCCIWVVLSIVCWMCWMCRMMQMIDGLLIGMRCFWCDDRWGWRLWVIRTTHIQLGDNTCTRLCSTRI